jgi:hypothetical protein
MLEPAEEAKLSRGEGAQSPTLLLQGLPPSPPSLSMTALFELYEKKFGILGKTQHHFF